jgi:hypothetical protein
MLWTCSICDTATTAVGGSRLNRMLDISKTATRNYRSVIRPNLRHHTYQAIQVKAWPVP